MQWAARQIIAKDAGVAAGSPCSVRRVRPLVGPGTMWVTRP